MRELSSRNYHPNLLLVVGVALGLALGLLIGWVLWPVDWQGASLDELYSAPKAEYLAAVAESYAMYSSPEAAATAKRRLAPLGADLSSEFESAIAYFSESNEPDKALRISNLNSLASALDVTMPNLVGATQPQNADAAPMTAPPPAPNSAATTETTERGGLGWGGWALGALAAIALILGGVYLLMLLTRRAQPIADDPTLGKMIDRQIGSLRPSEPAGYVPATRYVDDDDNGDEHGHAANAIQDEPEEYQFDDEPEDYTRMPAVAAGPRASTSGHYTPYSLDAEPGDPLDELEEEPDDEEEMQWQQGLSAAPASTAMREPPPIRIHSRPATGESNAAANVRLAASARPEVAARPTTVTRGTTRFKLLEIYSAHYQAGIHDYDESHPITDSKSARYIGECGMGVSTKNGLLQNYPDQVVALEVWLFDKTDEKNIGSQTRVLLSEYAIDHNLEQAFLKERQSDPRPITAQPCVRFQLESQSLLLDCTIVEAVYVDSGPTKGTFQSVKVEMAVHREG
jgi:hypothetical protein